LDSRREALGGVRVLDLADESGAYCGKLLADMGADVIKLETPQGDPARRIGPSPGDGLEAGFPFRHQNANKRSAVLDLALPAGRLWLHRLARGADVLVATGTPSQLRARGLTPAALAGRHPHLVIALVSPFGQSGPRREWRGCDLVAQAAGGMLFVNGHPDEAPLRSLGPQSHQAAGLHAAIGVLLALIARERTGRGQTIDVSAQESVLSHLEHASGAFHESGEIAVRRGTLHWSRTFRIGRCRDGYALLSSAGDWTSLVEWLKADGGAGDLAEPPWEDAERRREECGHLFDVLDEWASGYVVGDLVDGAQLRRLPFAAVRSLSDVADHPQLRARGFFRKVRGMTYPGAPYRFGATPWRFRRRPPRIGEHTEEVLAEARAALSARPGARGGRAPAGPGAEGRQRVLAGVRVLDFTWVVAGPVATRVLADHGADVIKIERRDAAAHRSGRGGATGNLNRGKRSVAIDLSDARGVDLVRSLAQHCDVVIDNFSSRVMDNWGLGFEALRRARPDVIAVGMSGFGRSGPYRDRVSYGPTLHAECGYTFHMRHAGGEPAGWGFSYSDMVGGYSAALAVLMALRHRARTGEGQYVDVSQLEALAASIGPPLLEVLNGGAEPRPGNGSAEGRAVPHGVYRCRDRAGEGGRGERWCAIAVFDDTEWRRCARAMGHPEWATDERFASAALRLAHEPAVDALVAEWASRNDADDAVRRLQEAGVAAGLVASAADLCERDAHLRARGYWATARGAGGEVFVYDGIPIRLSDTPGFFTAAPLVGEHTDEVLRELLGLDPEEIDRLRRDGVVGTSG
jgi:crotonobetainyl-CoA:carnitine CoA-transferase CaiB-like acyl-CoA transferase